MFFVFFFVFIVVRFFCGFCEHAQVREYSVELVMWWVGEILGIRVRWK